MTESKDLQEILKPFYQRASESEDRLTRLEAAIASKRSDASLNSGNEEPMKMIDGIQSKLEARISEMSTEREKVQKELERLTEENAKLQYRILHLVRALKEADCKLMSK